MQQRLADYRLFWREFRQTFNSTGAVLPSGRALGRALASRLDASQPPRRILEVGPGTGAVTDHIVAQLADDDRLDLVELNARFAGVLRERLQTDSRWRAVADRVRVFEMPMEELEVDTPYDAIVSGLPLNNFSSELFEQIFRQFHRLAAPDAKLSFFEYVAVRKAKALCSKPVERRRLSGIERLLDRELAAWEVARQCIWANLPPAWVHHLQLPGMSPETRVESREPGARSALDSRLSPLDSK